MLGVNVSMSEQVKRMHIVSRSIGMFVIHRAQTNTLSSSNVWHFKWSPSWQPTDLSGRLRNPSMHAGDCKSRLETCNNR